MPLHSLLIGKLNPREVIKLGPAAGPGCWRGPTVAMGGGTVGTFIKNRAHVIRWAGLAPHPAGPASSSSEQWSRRWWGRIQLSY
ncbi:Hypothetical protein FKW44_005541 [Caligus rogercresseyi]|uniref:Uncharacterized protein n=1 Tax=Caligus rogercresseyi TaxID=217165 RepID=A0A7T8KC53_CALRO|nr:Hypothetical protein FKW44_005541 [Caligus rogercresseyi]